MKPHFWRFSWGNYGKMMINHRISWWILMFIGATKHPAKNVPRWTIQFFLGRSPSVLMLWIAYTVDYSGPSIELVLCSILPCSPMIAKSPKCGVNAGQAYYHRGLPKMGDPKSSSHSTMTPCIETTMEIPLGIPQNIQQSQLQVPGSSGVTWDITATMLTF